VYAAKKDKDRITEVLARIDKTERVYRIAAKMYCDSTGDCRLGLEAGAEIRTGREARSEFNESLAPEKAVDETLGSSIMFTSRRYPKPMPFTPPSWARKITKEHVRHRQITEWDYGYWWIEWGGDRDLIGDNERIRFELLSIATGLWDYIKNSGEFPETECWALDWLGMIPAKRGSRRLVGDHILTQDDVTSRDFEDAVTIGGWPLDDHPARGFDRPDIAPNTSVATPPFNIPLRCLYSRNIPNLFMAGRNISCSHVAFTSTRVMGTCAAEGQAVGTAAAMCVHDGIAPREIVRDKQRLQTLQQTLLRDDQTIKRRVNQDSKDLARVATVTASGQEAGAEAAKVIDGYLRDVYERGERTEIHQWTARMGADGAWIELKWDSPRQFSEIQITFDTGLRRTLMLSGDGSLSEKMIRAPQPETVRDYTISYRRAETRDSNELVSAKGNYRRLVRHQFTPVEAQSIRIHVTATNGGIFARIFEVRCY
ncbi:MAG: FAD-dependent oxidoreductase, partial [Bryobacteraceae bacterium]